MLIHTGIEISFATAGPRIVPSSQRICWGGVSKLPTLFVQTDGHIVVDSTDPVYAEIGQQLACFSDLISQSDHLQVYRMTPSTLWQAAAAGHTPREVLGTLRSYAHAPLSYDTQQMIVTYMSRWGTLHLRKDADDTVVLASSGEDLNVVLRQSGLVDHVLRKEQNCCWFPVRLRAEIKQRLASGGYPCDDHIGYQHGANVPLSLQNTTLRDYQQEAMKRFLDADDPSGVIVLPCGAGKTVVGIACVASLQVHTLILTPSETSTQQWLRELARRTSVAQDDVGPYESGKPIRPITVATYQRLAARTRRGQRKHLEALMRHEWGLVIYDEVHMLPAPLFRLAADMQSIRRLGLTATLVREDGAETDVFSLIGPNRYEVSWKRLEAEGYLAPVRYVQVRVPCTPELKTEYAQAGPSDRQRLASTNPVKWEALTSILKATEGAGVLIIGHYLEQLEEIAARLCCPLITGDTPQTRRDALFEAFRRGQIHRLVLSRVANMAVDIPNANVAIQLSGLYGSRQEEAQRLGRLLRPDSGPGTFFSLVSAATIEADRARHRGLFLAEQGYRLEVLEFSGSDTAMEYKTN